LNAVPSLETRRARAFAGVSFVIALLAVSCTGCKSRQPGPNDAYLDPRVSAEAWNQLFESTAREIYEKRTLIVDLAAVKPGMSVVDVGAGTGLFTMMLSDAVGADGLVYAEEVNDKFSRYLAVRALREKRGNVVSVVGTDRSIGLPPGSVDLAFLCDVYHHFDHPEDMLASIRAALRDRGAVFLVEFRREPGRSPTWVFEHVRAGEQVVLQELEHAGFVPLFKEDSLRDSYIWRLRRASITEVLEAAASP
jgi:predicted methyltransferase